MPGRWTRRPIYPLKFIQRCVHVQARRPITHASGRILTGDDLGSTRTNEHQTFRVRKDETATELPLSPLLDAVSLKQKSRWKTPKRQPDVAHFTPLQKRLQENPYGG